MTSSVSVSERRTDPPARDTLLEVEDITVTFPSEAGPVQAVRGVSYTVRMGESLGISSTK